ncbi:hypothetical protein R1sor_027465 [Riccia sorocarpa]|uniref:Replitron HUH endonuclease domain-containing protein n=1 Tax=Riccia sorocarpa TaxID=122646 RepID=A0ABD3GG13_9MARC
MHRIPVKTTYKVQEPYPEQLTLTQLIDISEPPKEFKLTEVCWWIGPIGIILIPQQWSAELLDWFLPKLEYVCVRRLGRGKQVAAGPFKYCRSSEWFITLADADNKEISHPKYLKKESETECTYSSTAVCIWSPHCLCKLAAEERRDLGVHCICQVVFDRYSCNCQQLHQAEAVEVEILDGSIEADKVDASIEGAYEKDETKKEAEKKELDEVTVIKDTIVKDASAARAVKIPKAATPKRKTEPKEFNISLTLGIAGVDAPGEIFDKLKTYLEEKATMTIMAFERGDAHLLLHIQSMFTIRTTSTRKLKEDIRAAVGWKDTASLGNSLCVRSLKEKGLHTTTGLIGYCLKDEREPHFRLYTKNITEKQMEEGRRVHFIYGASEYKNKVQLTPANVLLCALQYRRYRTKSPISVSFRNCFKQMVRSGQYMPGLKWATMKPMSQLHVERIWQGCVAPETITITDVDYILFGSSHNDRYFSSSHRMELLIAEARKRKEQEDHKPDDPVQVMDGNDDRQDGPEETDDEKVAGDAEEDRDPFEVPRGNETPATESADVHHQDPKKDSTSNSKQRMWSKLGTISAAVRPRSFTLAIFFGLGLRCLRIGRVCLRWWIFMGACMKFSEMVALKRRGGEGGDAHLGSREKRQFLSGIGPSWIIDARLSESRRMQEEALIRLIISER